MITLRFQNVENTFLNRKMKSLTDKIFFGAFLGHIVLKIDEKKFYGEYPVLGFARALKGICVGFSQGENYRVYIEPTLEDDHELQFRLDQNLWVTVSSVHRKTGTTRLTARVSLDELTSESNKFLDHTIRYCAALCPEIESNTVIQKWLTDFSIPDFKAFMDP